MAANNSKRKQLEKRLADAQIYLKEYNRGDHSVVVSNLMSNKLERNIKKLEKQLAGMLPEITVTAKPKPSNNTTAKQRRTAIEGAGYNLKPKTPTKPKPKPKTGRSGMGNEDYQGGMSVQSKAKRAQDKKARVALEAKDKANAAKKKATAQRRKAVEGAGYNLTEKKKKSSSRSGTGMNAYQNMNFNRRK